QLLDAGVNKPIWYTELGTPTGGPGSVDEATQATYFSHYFQAFADLSAQGIPFGVHFIYELQDGAPDPSSEEPYFGITHQDGSDKPAAPIVRAYAQQACQ